VTYTASDGINVDTTISRVVKVGLQPDATINGANPFNLEKFDIFNDPGITINDSNSTLISTTSTVSNTQVGTYIVNYTVSNPAFTKIFSRIVRVDDTIPPVITIAGDNPYTLERFYAYIDQGATGDRGTTITTDLSNVQNTSIGSFIVVYNATDGNTAHDTVATRTVNVVDTIPPVVTITGDNPYTLERFDVYTDPGATVDRGTLLTTDVTAVNNLLAHGDSFIVTYTGSDGNTAHDVTVTRTVNIQDTKPPQLTILGDNPYSMQPYGYFPDLDPGVEVDAGTSYSINYSDINNNNVDAGFQTVVYTASDGVHPDVIKTRVVAVADTISPVITIIGDNPYTLERYAEYVDEGAIVDEGSTLETTISTVDNTTVGSYTVTYTATDNINPDTTVSRIVNVVDTSAPVVILNGASTFTMERFNSWSDVDPGVTIDASGTLVSVDTSLLDNTTQGTYTVAYNVVDDQNNANVITREVVVVDTVPPVVTLNDPYNVYTLERYGVWADIDPGVTMDEGSYLHEVILNNAAIGVETVQYIVKDGTNQTVKTRNIVISDNTPPVIIINGGEYTTTERFETYVDLGATVDQGSFITTTDLSNVDTSGPHNSTFDVVYTATDQGGNFSTVVRTVTVIDTVPPVITITDGASITADGYVEYIDAGATVDQGSTLISTDLSNVDTTLLHGSTFDVVYTAYDGNSTTTAIRTVTVLDITPPFITMTGGNFTTTQRFIDYVDPGATVDAGSTLISTDLSNVDTTLPHNSLFDVVYYATDEAGNSNTSIRTVIVKDGILPIATLNGANPFTIERYDSWVDVDPGIELDAGSYITSITGLDNTQIGTYTLTYNLSDDINSNTITRTVIVSDTTPPVASLVPNDDILPRYSTYTDPGIENLDVGSYLANTDLSNVNSSLPHESKFVVVYDIGDGNVYQNTILTRTVTVVTYQSWSNQGTLYQVPTYTEAQLGAGSDMSLTSDGTYMVVGSPYRTFDRRGAVSVFARSGSSWTHTQLIYIYPTTSAYDGDYFGAGVAIARSTKNYIAVSVSRSTTYSPIQYGQVYIYYFNGSTWSLGTSVIEPDIFSGNFGETVALSGDGSWLAVSRMSDSATYDCVFVYQVTNGSSSYLHSILKENSAYTCTNVNISLDGTYICYRGNNSVVIYTLSNNTWIKQYTITSPPGLSSGAYFGISIKMSGDGNYIIVGTNGLGAYVHKRSGSYWYLEDVLNPTGADTGYSVAINDNGKYAIVYGGSYAHSYARTGSTWYYQGVVGPSGIRMGLSGNGKYAVTNDDKAAKTGDPGIWHGSVTPYYSANP
jgi:phosphotransferase system IIA component